MVNGLGVAGLVLGWQLNLVSSTLDDSMIQSLQLDFLADPQIKEAFIYKHYKHCMRNLFKDFLQTFYTACSCCFQWYN